MEKVISIIVPIYKVEQYMCRCVDSILGQTYPHLDIILIDDGSPDACPQMCDAYAEKDSRVRTFHKPNGGVSSARNRGLQEAKGDYIMFVDSDDYIALDYCERLIAIMRRTNADIVCSNCEEVITGNCKKELPDVIFEQDAELHGHDTILYECCKGSVFTNQIWSKLYKKELVENLRFDTTLKFAEDVQFVARCFGLASHVYLFAYAGYFYYRNDSSVTNHDKTYTRQIDTLQVLWGILQKCKAEHSPHIDAIGERMVSYLMMCYEDLLQNEPNKAYLKMALKQYRKYTRLLMPHISRAVNARRKVLLLLLQINYTVARRMVSVNNARSNASGNAV